MRPLVLVVALLAACHSDCSPTSSDAGSSLDATHSQPPSDDAGPAPARLRVTNKCEVPVWIQQQGFPTDPLVQLAVNASHEYQIPAAGLASTRFWPKILCDKDGNDCKIGQSSPPCPATGCAPPVDSKLEATWGCTLSDKTKCGYTPQGVQMLSTFWNTSNVDGFTLPYTVKTVGGDGRASCENADCAGLKDAKCPTDEDLSNGGLNPKYTHQNLATKNPVSGGYAGCFSPCSKLSYPTWGGDGQLDISGPVDKMFCCPTPPVSSPECQAGPVAKTSYVKTIHTACKSTTYAYAYDDVIGGRNCSSDTILEFTVGPGCVAIAAK
jgi:hypothetical protein